MAKCAACQHVILFGGVRDGDEVYCNKKCQMNGMVHRTAVEIPPEIIEYELIRFHQGPCPVCGGAGPVDVHRSHFAQSFLIVTRWGSKPVLSCRACAKKAQMQSLLSTAALGWWGFPWGLIATPIQIVRNISALAGGGPNPTQPSAELERFVRASVARNVMSEAARPAAAGED